MHFEEYRMKKVGQSTVIPEMFPSYLLLLPVATPSCTYTLKCGFRTLDPKPYFQVSLCAVYQWRPFQQLSSSTVVGSGPRQQWAGVIAFPVYLLVQLASLQTVVTISSFISSTQTST